MNFGEAHEQGWFSGDCPEEEKRIKHTTISQGSIKLLDILQVARLRGT